MPRRARRTLTRDERNLWDRVRATATPLRPEPPPEPVAPLPPPLPDPRAPPRAPEGIRGPAAPVAHRAAPGGSAMDRKRLERLRRGRMEPEARLDLHGLRAGPAHAALTRFILGAHAEGRRLVLVITGKGRPEDAEPSLLYRPGILRHSVPSP